tara:strand:- start:722 stop:1585 length:864 start_codon:yes stop_codon:yes gene_type:complete
MIININDIKNNLINFKLYLLISFVLIFGSVTAYHFFSDPIYLSEATFEVRENQESNENILSSYSSLANLAGVSIPDSGPKNFNKVLQKIESRSFLYNVINENNLSPYLLAYKKYDKVNKKIILDKDLYDQTGKKFIGKLAKKSDAEILESSYQKLLSLITFSETQLGHIKIYVKTISPQMSKDIIIMVKDSINKELKDFDKKEIEESIEYLTKKINEQIDASVKKSFVAELLKHERQLMTINIRTDYVLYAVDGPNLPVNKYSPNLLLSLIYAISLFTAVIAVFLIL